MRRTFPTVSVSAYQNGATNTLVIVATNYSGSSVVQPFSMTNAPAFRADSLDYIRELEPRPTDKDIGVLQLVYLHIAS